MFELVHVDNAEDKIHTDIALMKYTVYILSPFQVKSQYRL